MLLTAVSILIIAVCGIFAAMRHYMMLQQSSYFASRYIKWLVGAFSIRTAICVAFLIVSIISLIFNIQYLIIIIAALSLVRIRLALSDNKKAIKKLVFTARIKRMILCGVAFMCLILAAGFVLSDPTSLIFYSLCLFLSFLPSILCLISLALTAPLDKCIANYYINDAKKLLASMPSLKVIGITGSFGKTSTKYILNRILSEKFNCLMTPESFNTPLGIVRTIREGLKPETEVFIAEMGAKNRGDIKEVCDIANPSIGIITSVGPQHLDTFSNIENVRKTKFELYDCVSKNGGITFVNGDNEIIRAKALSNDFYFYGRGDTDRCKATNIAYNRDGVCFDVVCDDAIISLKCGLLGIHNVQNITAAVAVALSLSVSVSDIKYAVSKLTSPPHRLEMKPFVSGAILIDDAYNANPVGCIEAVHVLGSFDGMKKIIVTPGLIELGNREYDCNKALGREAASYCDICVFVGKKRSVALLDGANEITKDDGRIFVAQSFRDALAIITPLCDKNTVVLFENDLPDNYAG